MKPSHLLGLITALSGLLSSVAWGQPAYSDALVQSPVLSLPQRGSLVGLYSGVAFGAADLSRGVFTLNSPFTAPTDRGPLMASPFPVYSPESGLSEWGLGWQAPLCIQRTRLLGTIDYSANDDLTGRWGRMVRGTDAYYPAGLQQLVRVVPAADMGQLVAYLPDGSTWTFGGPGARIVNSSGTYAWCLREARTVTGRKTHFTYLANDSGRLFVQEVSYGGVEDDFQYSIQFSYEGLPASPSPFTDYHSGTALVLDRRVRTVTVRAYNSSLQRFDERWHYGLSYDEEGLGPAFFLTQVARTFASGETPPPVRYGYFTAAQRVSQMEFHQIPELQPAIARFGLSIIQPNVSSIFDINNDGRPDFEEHTTYTLFTRADGGFQQRDLERPTDPIFERCRFERGSLNPVRKLVQMVPSEEGCSPSSEVDCFYQVIDMLLEDDLRHTDLTVCNRQGVALATQRLDGNWELGANTKMADLNGDKQPDLIRLFGDLHYEALPNQSLPGAYQFGAAITGQLLPPTEDPGFSPGSTWIVDINGDGIPDIVSRSSLASSIVVWFGKGNFRYADRGLKFRILTTTGGDVALSNYEVSFTDFNKDGQTDLVLSNSGSFSIYLNKGSYFQAIQLPDAVVHFFAPITSRPVVADFSASGNSELTVIKQTLGDDPHAYGLSLDGPEVGLLQTADDGMGTLLGFSYSRALPSPSVRQRHSVLSGFTVESSGHDRQHYDYLYQRPTLHSLAKFLVGFDHVVRQSPLVTDSVDFANADRYAGLLTSSTTHDGNSPLVDRFETREYQTITSFGLDWQRPVAATSGWQKVGAPDTLSERTEYLEYQAEVCLKKVRRNNGHGLLVTENSRASVPGWENALHCLVQNVVLTGTHSDSALNFRYEGNSHRNSAGLVDEVQSIAPGETLIMQQVVYNPDFTIQSITAPGRGATHFDYQQDGSRLLRQVITPELKALTVTGRNALTDQVSSLDTNRGELMYQTFYTYDGQERLRKEWSSLGGASESNPNQTYAYQYATATHPASAYLSTLVDAAGIGKDSVEFQTAAGEAFTNLTRIPEGWATGSLIQRLPSQGRTNTRVWPTVGPDVDPLSLNYDRFLSGAELISSSTSSVFGHTSDQLLRYHADVQQHIATGRALNASGLLQTSLENDTYTTIFSFDAAQRPVRFEDQAHTQYTYVYDALGRLCDVVLPNLKHHRVAWDSHARVRSVEREGIAMVEYSYAPVTGLPTLKKLLTPSGQSIYQRATSYDNIARPSTEIYTDLLTQATQQYRYYYDGATPDNPLAQNARGFLTAVTGDGFEKRFEYRADGLLNRRVVSISNWRTLVTEATYFDDNSTHLVTVKVLDPLNHILFTTTQASARDDFGRTSTIALDGRGWATHHYDRNGNLSDVTFPNGDSVTYDYDSLTRRRTGVRQQAQSWSASNSNLINQRGFLGTDNINVDRVIGGQTHLARIYDYSPTGFLTSSQDEQSTYLYGFDAFGLPTFIEENGVRRTLGQQGDCLVAGDVRYCLDGLGRTIQRGDLALSYSPSGQVALARRGADSWTFLYDEAGQRLAKFASGSPVAGYFEEGYLDAAGALTQPVKVGDGLVGVIERGVFRLLAADARGTVTADADGTPRVPSPFGSRLVHPDISAALDYVEKAYDPDLALIRMGVRDYDPKINRFLTPDPSALESVDFCVKSPVDCNLYSYSRNNPALYRDSNGRHEEVFHGGVTYVLAMKAGYTQDQAAQLALANAGVDHNPATSPSLSNIPDGTVYNLHFDKGVVSEIEWQIDRGIPNIRDHGISLHTLMDVGTEDAPGPHYQGLTNYLPTLFGPLPGGHPWGLMEDGEPTWPGSHSADQAFHSPTANLNELKMYYGYLRAGAQALNGDKILQASEAEVVPFMKQAIDLRTREQVMDFLGTSPDGVAPSYLALPKPWSIDTSLWSKDVIGPGDLNLFP